MAQRQRVGTHMCARCRRVFNPGDRVTTLYIVEKVGKGNSNNPMELGAWLSSDFELAHFDCNDASLSRGTVIG